MWNNKNIFEPSGCISREAFEALVMGNLPDDIKVLVDTHIAKCPFCADAKEGFEKNVQKSAISEVLHKADSKFNKMIEARTNAQKNKRILWTAISAAAIILILIGLFNILNREEPKQQIAENKPLQSDTTIANSDSLIESKNKLAENTVVKKEKVESKIIKYAAPIASDEVSEAIPGKTEEIQSIAVETRQTLDDIKYDKVLAFDSLKNLEETEKKEDLAYQAPAAGMEMTKKTKYRAAETSISSGAAKDLAFSIAVEPPRFKNGDLVDFQTYIQQQVCTITDTSKMSQTFVQFVIDEKGRVTNPRIIKSGNPEFDSIILRQLLDSPKWKPGKQNGKSTSTQLVCRIYVKVK